MLTNVDSGYNITNVHQGSSKQCPIYSTMSQESSGPDSSNISTTTSGQNRLKTPFVGENTAELRIGIFAKYCRIMNWHTSKIAISVQYVLPILNSAYLSVTLSSMPIFNSAYFSVIKFADSLFSIIYIEIYTSLAFTHSPPLSTSTMSSLPSSPPQPSPRLNLLTYYNLFLSFYSAMDHPPKQWIQCTLPIPTRNQRHLHNAPNLIRLGM